MCNGVNRNDRDIYFLYAETQLHAGAGSDLGVIDLPIQRERATKFPIIQGVKGALRSYATTKAQNCGVEDIFGSELGTQQDNNTTKPGCVAFSEAKILLFPVRNPEHLFVWVTCPLALSRYLHAANDGDIEQDIMDEFALICSDNEALSSTDGQSLFLEEIKVNQKKYNKLGSVFEKLSCSAPIKLLEDRMKKDTVVVSDDLFSKIVETMTEVVPRIAIENGVAKKGSLWYEEYLPQDTVMYFVARTTNYGNKNHLDDLRKMIDGKLISIGGKETVGKGMAWVKCCRQEG